MINQFDSEQIYCRKLGQVLQFGYCRIENKGLPCLKCMDCWFERIDVRKFMETNYSEEERKTAFSTPKDRLSTIFDIITNAASNSCNKNADK
jgi:hypothetical protein